MASKGITAAPPRLLRNRLRENEMIYLTARGTEIMSAHFEVDKAEAEENENEEVGEKRSGYCVSDYR